MEPFPPSMNYGVLLSGVVPPGCGRCSACRRDATSRPYFDFSAKPPLPFFFVCTLACFSPSRGPRRSGAVLSLRRVLFSFSGRSPYVAERLGRVMFFFFSSRRLSLPFFFHLGAIPREDLGRRQSSRRTLWACRVSFLRPFFSSEAIRHHETRLSGVFGIDVGWFTILFCFSSDLDRWPWPPDYSHATSGLFFLPRGPFFFFLLF